MEPQERKEIVALALEGQVNPRHMALRAEDYLRDRRESLEDRVQQVNKISVLRAAAKASLRKFHEGRDHRAAFHMIAANVLEEIAEALGTILQPVPGRQALEALRDMEIPPLPDRVEEAALFDVRQEIRSMIIQNLTTYAIAAYCRVHRDVEGSDDVEEFFEISDQVSSAFEAEGL